MAMSAISVFLSADIPKDDNAFEQRDILMRMFFDGISERGISDLSKCNKHRDFCSGWLGITCENGDVKGVEYTVCGFGNFNIHALPHTITKLHINGCHLALRLRTRLLPRELIRLSLMSNKLYGSVDLGHLPSKLKLAYFRRNDLTGPIELTRLPRHLQHLDLRKNKIQQQTVYYDNLPETIEYIHLSSNQIQEVRAVHKKMAIANKSIFAELPTRSIH